MMSPSLVRRDRLKTLSPHDSSVLVILNQRFMYLLTSVGNDIRVLLLYKIDIITVTKLLTF